MRRTCLALAFLAAMTLPGLAAQPVKSYSSGNVANASAAATITGTTGQFSYITGFEITFTGATAAACVSPTVTGVLGGTMTYSVCAPAGATLQGTPLIVAFTPPLQSSATNTNIVVTLPALGAGNARATVVAHGYVE